MNKEKILLVGNMGKRGGNMTMLTKPVPVGFKGPQLVRMAADRPLKGKNATVVYTSR